MLAALQTINKLLQTKDYNFIKTNSLTAEYFAGFEKEFIFIDQHYQQFGNIPDVVTFLEKFPNFELTEVNETDDYLLDRLYEDYGFRKFAPFVTQLGKVAEEDSRKAYNFLMEHLNDLKPHTVCKGIDIISQALERYELFKNRADNPESVTIKTGLIELDEILGGWDMGDELVTVVARTNQGKCLEKGTKVLMADGTLKKVEDIQVGDKVQSENMVNTVVGLHNGVSKGYKIIPNVGKNQAFVVSENHILTCMYKKYDVRNTRKLVDIMVEDYINLPENEKRHYYLYRPRFEYDTKTDLKIPPYILGIWLGDGNTRNVTLTNIDKPVIDAWHEYANSLDLHVTVRGKHKITFDITTQTKKGPINRNQAILDFKHYGFLGKNVKHIPKDYLQADRQQRLELLAGIVDTDGWYDVRQKCYSITTKLRGLRDDYFRLIVGLGFKPTLSTGHVKLQSGEIRDYYTVSFSGDLQEIPVRLERKKHIVPTIKKDSQCTGFKIEEVPQIEYYGFECDGDHRFILENGFLTHNSWLLLKFLTEAWKQGRRVGLYSGEMSHIKLGYRFDALFQHFSNRALVRGAQVDGYEDYIKNMMTLPNPFIIITQKEFGGRPTVQKIRNFIEENNIEIMGIDQYSLMDDGRASMRDPTRIRLAHISEDLFLLSSEYKIPILGLAQANRDGINKDDQTQAPGLENIKESDDIAHNSSKCIGMRQSNFGLVLDIIKNREGKVGDKLLYSWDIDTAHFSYIPSAGDAAVSTTRQTATQQTKQDFQQSTTFNPF